MPVDVEVSIVGRLLKPAFGHVDGLYSVDVADINFIWRNSYNWAVLCMHPVGAGDLIAEVDMVVEPEVGDFRENRPRNV